VAAVPESASVLPTRQAEASYAKLRPGPGKPAAEVAAHQRARLHSAMVELVGTHGYGKVTVRALTRRAGVSSRAFYKHFDSKEDCFLQTYERVVRRAVKRIVAAQAGERDWRKRLRLAFDAFVQELEREPQAARLALIEVDEAGEEAREQVRRTEAMFEAMIAESFSRAPDEVALPELLIKGIVAGVARVARARLLVSNGNGLIELGEDLTAWSLSYYSNTCDLLSKLAQQNVLHESATRPSWIASGDQVEKDVEESRSSFDHRALILTAATKIIMARESETLTLSDLQAATGLSRRVLKSHFAGVEECLASARQLETRRIATEALTRSSPSSPWPSRTHQSFAYLSWRLACNPAQARVCFVDAWVSGAAKVQCRERVMEEMAVLVGGTPSGWMDTNRVSLEASVGAIWGVLYQAVDAESPAQLARRTAILSFLALAPQIGAKAAVEVIYSQEGTSRSPDPEPSPTKLENVSSENLTHAGDKENLGGARDYLVART
jgi:AcrR family transcriptional regulator